MNRRDLENHLRRHGCSLFRNGANHDIWINPANGLTTAVPRHGEIKIGTARGLWKQLGIAPPPGR